MTLGGKILQLIVTWFAMVGRGVRSGGPVITQLTDPVALAESPFWDEVDQVLFYVDIDGRALHRVDPETRQEQVLKFDQSLAFAFPLVGRRFEFLVAQGLDLSLVFWDYERGVHHVHHVLTVEQDRPGNRWNEAGADARGRLWAGTKGPANELNESPPDCASFYRVDTPRPLGLRRSAGVVLTPVSISNGVTWSLDNHILYFIDSPTRKVDAFDFDLDRGTIANRRTVFDLGQYNISGIPDGMTTDSEGNVWVTTIGPGLVLRVDPRTGSLLQTVQFPVTDTTSVAWGGADMTTLFVTTKRPVGAEAREKQPLAGAVFKVTGLGVAGPLAYKVVFNYGSHCHKNSLHS